ncbi:MAG: DNA primase [Gammaproteobacteria bacterium]|nr:MAG: DNA primase [Gammaproteobacteria bacterium]
MAGLIPKQFIEDLLLRVDIVDVIDARVPLKKAGKDYKARCPFHEEKTPSFTVSTTKQFYHCFGCGAHGTAISFLMEFEHMSFPEAVEELAARVGLPVPRQGGDAPDKGSGGADLLAMLQQAARYYQSQLREHPQAPQAVDYLKGRGISGETAGAFGLGYAPPGWDNLLRTLGKDNASRDALLRAGLAVKKEGGGLYDRFRDRVMFPIHDYRGRIVGFGGRVIGDGEPKYMNSPETPLFHKGRELYGLFRAREAIKRERRVLMVEGYMDVTALAQFGIDYAVATLGTATTREHLERVFRFAPEIIFCFDGDRAGREAAWRALENALPVLHEGRQISLLFLPEGEDPDSLVRGEGREAFAARVKQATPLPDYMFQSLVRQVDINRLDGRARLGELARPLLSKIPTGVFQQMMLDRLAELCRLDPGKLSKLLLSGSEMPGSGRHILSSAAGPKTPSMMRLAIALVVQHPELAADAPDQHFFGDLDLPGAPLLQAVLGLLKTRPGMNTAAIIEHFRDTEHQPHVAKLAAWQHPALQQDVAAEFQGVLDWLRKTAAKARTDRLLDKQRAQGLDSTEKAELARLLSEKQEKSGFSPNY